MRSALFSFAAFAASAMAAEVVVTWRHEKDSNSTSLSIQSAADRAVLAETCSSSMGSLNFYDADEDGAGHLTIGDKKFEIGIEPKDGPVCTSIYNEYLATVECTGIDMDIPEGAAKSADCFTHEHVKATFNLLKSRSVDILNATEHVEQPIEEPTMSPFHSRILGPRQKPEPIIGIEKCNIEVVTEKIGDGNP
jgi:hypothetical protein